VKAQGRAVVESRMNLALRKLGLPLEVSWTPDTKAEHRARLDVERGLIHLYSLSEAEAWASLIHEVEEYRLRPLLGFHTALTNTLIDFVQKQAYALKEKALEALSRDIVALAKEAERLEGSVAS